MKYVGWVYLIAYTAFWLLAFTMALITENGSFVGFLQFLLVLVPSYVLIADLTKRKSSVAFNIIGILSMGYFMADIHKFNEIRLVAPVMYALILPMILYLIVNGIAKYRRFHITKVST